MTEATQTPSISKGTYQLFVGNLASTFVLAIASIVVGRLIGPSNYGLYTIALIIPAFVYLVLRLGATSTITRYAAKYLSEGNEKKAISFSYTISIFHFALGLLVIGLLVPFSGVLSTDLLHRPALSGGIIIPIALLSVVGQILFYNGTAAFVGLHSFGKSAIIQNINAIAKLVISVVIVILGYPVLGAVLGFTFGFIAAGAISLVAIIVMNKSAVPRNIRQDIAMSADYAWPIFLSILFTGLVGPVQNTILALTVSNAEVGWYSQAVNISTFIVLFTYPITTALLPLFSRTVKGGSDGLANTYRLSVKYTAFFVTPVAMLVMALSSPLAVALLGHAYAQSGDYLLLLAGGYLLSGLGALSWSNLLYGVAETRKAFIATAIGSIVSVIVSIALVFSIGVYGVVIGTIAGQLVSMILGGMYVSETLGTKIQIWPLWRIYLSSAISAVLVYPITFFISNPFIVVVLGAVLFFLILIPVMTLTKALTKQDLGALEDQFKDVSLVKRLLAVVGRYQDLFLGR